MSDSPECSDPCPHQALLQRLDRQSAVMERLADLLPQLIAQNQMLIALLLDQEPEAPAESRYLDGSPIGADSAARP